MVASSAPELGNAAAAFGKAASASNRLYSEVGRSLFKGVLDSKSPPVIRATCILMILAVLALSTLVFLVLVNAVGAAVHLWMFDPLHYLLAFMAIIIIIVVPLFLLSWKAVPVANTYEQMSNLEAVTEARNYKRANRPSGTRQSGQNRG